MSKKENNAKVLVVSSGKGGVGKSTSSVNIGALLAKRGYKTCIVDFDVGLRKVDALMGLDRRVFFDFIQVMRGQAKLSAALIKDKEIDNLYILPTSNTEDKTALTDEKVEALINELKKEFDYIICDSPAGIEAGAEHAMHHADEAIIVVNPEIQSISDADRIIGLIDSKTKLGSNNQHVEKHLLVTKYNKDLIKSQRMIAYPEISDFLSLPVKGIIPSNEDKIINSSNIGRPLVHLEPNSDIFRAYDNFVKRILNEGDVVSIEEEDKGKTGFFKKMFGG